MANFIRTMSISPLPEHQEGFEIRNWEITDETVEAWTVEKDVSRPSLKPGEDTLQTVVLRKDQWKRI